MAVVRALTILVCAALFCGASFASSAQPSAAAPAPAPKGGAPDADAADQGTPALDKFVKGAEKQVGLFTIYRKDGKVFLELKTDQFGQDFLEHASPGNGLGGYGIYSGDDFQQEARLVRFVRTDDKHVALIWPQIRFLAQPNTPLATAVKGSTADSLQGIAPIVAEDKDSKDVVVDMSLLLGDTLDLGNTLSDTVKDPDNPEGGYRQDRERSYFGPTKAFPQNVIIEAEQTFVSMKPNVINTVVDPRAIQMRVKYNFAAILSSPDYMPRIADDRVGYFDDPHIRFDRDEHYDNFVHYVIRWNVKASDPSKPLSPAVKPIVYTLSNTIPDQYRQPIRDAILTWNKAFEKLGISDAVKVQDQPNDPNFDPEDVRYSMIRWLTEANGGGFAEAQVLWDPRTGEIFQGGVLIDADIMRFGNVLYVDQIQPANPTADPAGPLTAAEMSTPVDLWNPAAIDPAAYGHPTAARRHATFTHRDSAAHRQLEFGALALALYGRGYENIPPSYSYDFLKSIVLHEVGHDFGLQHNFIGHDAYTLEQLKNASWTAQHGVASSVMEYAPVNLWPKGSAHGDLFQTALGTYDYHVIHWGYAPVPGARTPLDEVPTLARWASAEVDPKYAFASDEDVQYDGHAVDPRVAQFLLSSRPIDWCEMQLGIDRHLLRTVDSRLPHAQQAWDQERFAVQILLGQYARCAVSMTHYVAGEFLSRAHRGDPGAPTPLSAVPRSIEQRAYQNLDRYLFADSAWQLSPATLSRSVYSEYAPFANFGYFPTDRHDISLTAVVSRLQYRALAYMFSPLMLERLTDLPTKGRPGATMSLADLFEWTQRSVFSDLASGKAPQSTLRRNLQRGYARLLARITVAPFPGTPYDAQALARHELVSIAGDTRRVLAQRNLDGQTRAHLEALQADVTRALEARTLVPVG